MNSAAPAPSSAATGPSAASDVTRAAAKTANSTVRTHRAASENSISVRGLIRSASEPPTVMSAARGIP